jgi:tetratricopeptide (TPR) repeat protein
VNRDLYSHLQMGDSATFRDARLQPFFIFLLAIACVVPILGWDALGMDDRAGAETHAILGLQFARRGDLVHAEQELRQAAKLAPANPEILTSLGTVLSIQKKLDEPSSVFKKPLQVSPPDLRR